MGILKIVEHESDEDTNCNWCSWYCHQRIGTGTGGLRNKRKSGGNPNYCTVKIGRNTAKSLGDLRRLSVTPTTGKDHQLKLVWTTSRIKIMIIHWNNQPMIIWKIQQQYLKLFSYLWKTIANLKLKTQTPRK